MNILVCISSVPDTTSKINFTENNTKFDDNGIQFVINPYDEFGLTKAMMLKESTGGKVTIITVGDTTVESVMRKALAIGADQAVRVNMNATDSFSTATEIANYINQNSFDLNLVSLFYRNLLSWDLLNKSLGFDRPDFYQK